MATKRKGKEDLEDLKALLPEGLSAADQDRAIDLLLKVAARLHDKPDALTEKTSETVAPQPTRRCGLHPFVMYHWSRLEPHVLFTVEKREASRFSAPYVVRLYAILPDRDEMISEEDFYTETNACDRFEKKVEEHYTAVDLTCRDTLGTTGKFWSITNNLRP